MQCACEYEFYINMRLNIGIICLFAAKFVFTIIEHYSK
jgi:hypothetical protein